MVLKSSAEPQINKHSKLIGWLSSPVQVYFLSISAEIVNHRKMSFFSTIVLATCKAIFHELFYRQKMKSILDVYLILILLKNSDILRQI